MCHVKPWVIKWIMKSMVLATLKFTWKNLKVDTFSLILNILMNSKCILFLYANDKVKS